MNTVKVRNLELGAGIPAICIPNVGKTRDEILSFAGQYRNMHMDLMEWRMDWYEDVEDTDKVLDVLSQKSIKGHAASCHLPYSEGRRSPRHAQGNIHCAQ